jgi:hypothetical protein
MTAPSAILGTLIALLLGALFHVWVDGGVGRFLLYLVLSSAGFWLGQWGGSSQGLIVMRVGPLNLGMAMAGSLVLLGIGHWLSRVEVETSRRGEKL